MHFLGLAGMPRRIQITRMRLLDGTQLRVMEVTYQC